MNICGVLVHAAPERVADVSRALNDIPGSALHATADAGRLVVTLEDTAEATALSGLEAIHRLPGVVAATLVYHHFDPDLGPADPPIREA